MTHWLALDSTILIRAVEGERDDASAMASRRLVFGRPDNLCFVVSELLLAEVLVRPMRLQNAELTRFYRRLVTDLQAFKLVPVTRTTLIEAARIRSALGSLKLPEAIHLATAKRAGCKALVTLDLSIPASAPVPIAGPDDPMLAEFMR